MAKKISSKNPTKVSKDQLRSSIQSRFAGTGSGGGIHAIIPKNIDEEIERDPEKIVKEFSQHFAMIPLKEIEPNPGQPRKDFDPEALEELAASIQVHGLIQPITVRRFNDHEFQIISGERRYRASQIAGLEEVPAYIRIANDQTILEMALIENIQRQDLNPFEVAVSYYRLKEECNLTDLELSKRVGKKRSTITNYLRLLDLHIEVIEALKKGELSMGHARAIAGIQDKLLQKQLLDKILNNKLSVRDAEKEAKKFSVATKKVKANLDAGQDYKAVLDDFKAFFGTIKVKIELTDKEKGGGRIVIAFTDTDELNEYFKRVEQ
ncbi:MAG: ParB/RepB/Spo0J family partition protein [Saprospiraceae bacterium]|nr:ParB/RepB/Spo0J family partition protein [Saprospiraceae bacterium]MCB9322323.1 ParB/RepB/Spo0J family partition protein [Lewinellaceae bacterium]